MKKDSLAVLRKALEHDQAGRLGEAETLYRSVLRDEPSNPDALHLLGVLELRRGKYDTATDWISKAVRVSPKTALYQNNLGLALQASGKLVEAVPCFEKATRLAPGLFDAHFNLGVVLQALEQTDKAIAAYEKALSLGKDPGTLNNLGAAYLKRRDVTKAISCFEQAVELKPDHADALHNLATALHENGQAEAAIAHFEKCARLPNPPPALPGQFALALQQCERLEQAEIWYRQALKMQPSPSACNNLAVILEQRFAFTEAEQLLRQAIALQPDYPQAFNNLGNVLLAMCRAEEAVLAYDHAINLKPDFVDAHYNRSLARLTLGDFAGGWNDYEYRWQWKSFPTPRPKFAQPEWTGDDLNGRTLLVYNEQGLGDTIQFGRYFGLAAACGGKVLFAGPPELETLFKNLPGLGQMIGPDEPLPAFDVHAALISLPRILGTRRETIPHQVPYLTLPPPARFPLPERKRGCLRVGVVWAGGVRHTKDKLRSIPLKEFLSLLQIPRCEFFSLQVGPKATELASLPAGLNVGDIGSRLNDFADTAAVIGQLDLLISADTATLHLAGALARPVWGLLPYAPDWRWMLKREDSPWYPTLRLFRQTSPGDWKGVFERVEQELDRVASQYEISGMLPQTEWFLPRLTTASPSGLAKLDNLPSEPNDPNQIFMSGQTTGGFGWGAVNRGLFDELSKLTKTTLITPGDGWFLCPHLPGFLLTTLRGHEFTPECPARGRVNLGNAVFEQELTEKSVENAKRFDVVFTASNWCLERLREKGIQNGALLLQGINTQVFHPAASPGPSNGGRFVLFSGGKFELRKGQDLVLRAFRELSRKFPDMTLVTAWHNLWPESLRTMAASSHIRFELHGATWPEQLAHLCTINDIDPKRVTAIKPAAPEQLAQVYHQADLGLFPNRCEGATNLVLMEFLACGKPAIVSFNSGHCDVVHDGNAILLKNQRALDIKDANGQVAARWAEVSVDDIIAGVEYAYHHREQVQTLGAAAGEDLKKWDWSRSARTLLDSMSRLGPR